MPGSYTHDFDTPAYKGSVTVNTGLFINGQWVDPVDNGEMIDVIDPTTGRVITSAAGGSSKDIDLAAASASNAYRTVWGLKTPGSERGKLLYKLAALIEKHQDALAALEALNIGKPFSVAKALDLRLAVNTFRYFGGWADKIHGKTIETSENKMAYTRHEPYGVVGVITPWNVPLIIISLKLSAALATGNTVVLKPSEITPFTALYLADLISEAGFPPGVVNIVNGYGNTAGAAIAAHPSIMKIAFTGSTLTGRNILRASTNSNLKKVSLELGGKSPTIVFEDVNLEQALKWTSVASTWVGLPSPIPLDRGVLKPKIGQACTAGSRIYVQEGIYDQFLRGFTKIVETITQNTGGPFDRGVQHGPQVSQAQFDRIMGYINSGKAEGARVHIGGERHGEQGYFIKPTVFVDVRADMKIMQEEIFGPVCSIVKFKTEEEVIKWANNTTYGLAANVLTENVNRAIRMAHALEAGTVFINCAQNPEVNVAMGGHKQSGLGKEAGQYALDTYTQVKAVHINIGTKL